MIALDTSLPPSLRGAAAEAAAADAAGFACGWVPETLTDPFPPASAALLATGRLRVGTAVAVAFARSPFVTAQAAWELSRASGGRFSLGLGTQVKAHVERRFSAPWDRPVARLREYVLAVREIWRSFQEGTPPAFEGEFYRHTLGSPLFDPGPVDHPAIPVLLAGVNPAVARLAGECADGLVAHPLHSRRYLHDVVEPAVRDGLARAGRERSSFQVLVPVWAVTAPAERDAVRARIAVYGSTRTYRRVFEAHGWDDVPGRLHGLMAAGGGPEMLAEMAAVVTDEMVDAFALVCGPGDLAAGLRDRLGGLADRCMLYEPVPPALSALDVAGLAAALAA